MSIPSITDRLEAATAKAEGASQIMHDVANGGPLVEVPTESGPVPSLQRWYADLNDRTSGVVGTLAARVDKAVLSYPDFASAQAAAATLPDGQQARIEADETHNGRRTWYVVQSGGLVFQGMAADSKSTSYGSGDVEGVLDGRVPYGPTDPVDWYYGGPQIRRPMFSTGDMNIFIDPAVGNDSNPGTQAQPIKTLKEAVQRLPERIFHKIRVYLLDGTYPADDCIRLFNYYVTARGRAGLRFVGHVASLDGETHPIYTDTNPSAVVVQGFEHMNSGVRGTEELYFAGITFKNGWYEVYDSYSIFVDCKFDGGHRSPGWNTYHAVGGHYCQMDFIRCDFSNLAQIGTLTNFANATFESCTLSGLHMTSDAPNPGRPFMATNRSTIYLRNSPQLLQTGPGGKSITTTGGYIYDFDYSPMGYAAVRRASPDRDESLYLLGHDGGALGSGRGAGIELNGVNHPTAPGRATVEFAGGGTTPKFRAVYDSGGSPQEVFSASRYGEVTAKANLIFSSQARTLSTYLQDGQATFYTNPTTGDVFVVSKLGGVMKYARLLEFATAPVIT